MSRLRVCQRAINLSLYAIANRPSFSEKGAFFRQITELVRGGVSCVQLRDHEKDVTSVIQEAAELKEQIAPVPLIINTRNACEVAKEVGAAGVHLEHASLFEETSQVLGSEFAIGVSVRSVADIELVASAASYISIKVFASKQTCPYINDTLWGFEGLEKVRGDFQEVPIVAVGGLTEAHIVQASLILNDTDGIAMAGALMRAEHPFEVASRIQKVQRKVRRQYT